VVAAYCRGDLLTERFQLPGSRGRRRRRRGRERGVPGGRGRNFKKRSEQ
jgi:hypothetical protein